MHCSNPPPASYGGNCNKAAYQAYSGNVVQIKSSLSYSSSSSSSQGGVVETSSYQSSASSTVVKVDGFKVFESALQRTYEYLANRNTVEVAGISDEPLSAESVANNILGFIERRLQKDMAEGATQEQLQERLEQGLAGFKKGFAEAKEQIEALGWLNPTIEEDIGKTYDLVIDGIEDLRAKFVEGITTATNDSVAASKDKEVAAANKSEIQNTAAVAKKPAKTSSSIPSLAAAYGHYSYAQVNSFKFELETADGDTVTIRASTKDLYAADYRFGSYNTGNAYGEEESFYSQSFSSSRFHVDVDGHLDEDELMAIDALLAKVEDLSIDFFEGDFDAAYQQALDLGYNTEEIVGFSLNLRQVEVERFTAAYQQVAPQQASPANAMAQRLQPLSHFVKDLLDAVDHASKFGDGLQLVTDLADQIEQAQVEQQADSTSVVDNAGAQPTQAEKTASENAISDKTIADKTTAEQKLDVANGYHHGHRKGQGFAPFVKQLLDGLPQKKSYLH